MLAGRYLIRINYEMDVARVVRSLMYNDIGDYKVKCPKQDCSLDTRVRKRRVEEECGRPYRCWTFP